MPTPDPASTASTRISSAVASARRTGAYASARGCSVISRQPGTLNSATRATIAAVQSFAGQVTMTGMLMIFGVLAQGVSYRADSMGCGGTPALIGLGALVRNRLRGGAG